MLLFDTQVCHERQISLRFHLILKMILEMAFKHIAHRFESWIEFLWPLLAKLYENAFDAATGSNNLEPGWNGFVMTHDRGWFDKLQ